jgi:hypothetical protein
MHGDAWIVCLVSHVTVGSHCFIFSEKFNRSNNNHQQLDHIVSMGKTISTTAMSFSLLGEYYCHKFMTRQSPRNMGLYAKLYHGVYLLRKWTRTLIFVTSARIYLFQRSVHFHCFVQNILLPWKSVLSPVYNKYRSFVRLCTKVILNHRDLLWIYLKQSKFIELESICCGVVLFHSSLGYFSLKLPTYGI